MTDLHTKADEITAALGRDWSHTPGPEDNYCTIMTRRDGLTLHMSMSPDRIYLSAFDTGCSVHRALTAIPLLYPTGIQISCKANRSASAIAADIRRRLLPDAEAWWAATQAYRLKQDLERQAIDAIAQQFLAFPDVRIDQQHTATPTLLGTGFQARVHNERHVSLSFGALTPSAAISLLAAYYEHRKGNTH